MEFYGSCHNHTDRSNFRLRDATCRLDELCWYAAKDLKHNFIAITDHETVATFIDCQKIEKKIREKYPEFKVIRGNEIYLCRNGLSKENYIKGQDRFYHFILLARDYEGNRQIRELSTRAWSHTFKQGKMIRVPTYYSDLQEIIGANPGHVIFSQACIGSRLAQLVLDYHKNPSEQKWDYILEWIKHILQICGKENYFLEVQPSFSKEQIIVNQTYKKISQELDIPVVISLDTHYLKKEDEPIHHAFLTAQEGERETKDFYASTYMMSREEIHSYMDESLGVETVSLWMNNTKKIYDMCEDYDLTKPLHIPYLPLNIDKISKEDFLEYKDKIKELEYFYTSEYQSDRDMAAALIKKIKSDPEQYDNEATFMMMDDNLAAVRISSDKQNTRWSAYLLNMRDYIKIIWEKGDSLVGCSRGCFYPDEKVLLSNGQEKKISEIEEGEAVFNHDGQINKVLKVLSYDVDEDCYVVKGKGKEPIHCTRNHKFWIKRCSHCENPAYKNSWCKETCRKHGKCTFEKGHETLFVPAEELRVGDMLAYPKPKLSPAIKKIDMTLYLHGKYYFIKDNRIGYYVGNNTKIEGKSFSRYIELDEDLAYLCGVFIGDGWTKTESQSEIGLAFNSENKKDLDSLERCKNILFKYGLEVHEKKSSNKKVIQLIVYSKLWWSFFRENLGSNSYEKHVSDWLITSDEKITKALLLGLMASDGHYDCGSGKNERICYDSVNLNLIKQVQLLWASIGIYGNFRARTNVREGWSISYKWAASGKQLAKLIKDFPLIKIKEDKKFSRQDYLEDENCFYTIIESINVEKYKGKVYDLSVENIHSYVINGSAVHNSGGGFLLLNMLDITQINPLREKAPIKSWRFLNPERASVLDIDTDIEGGKRPQVYKALQDAYGDDRVSKVLTIRTEKSKSALLTACRGLKIDPDEASFLASFIKSDRGQARTLTQTYYGDAENNIAPDLKFKELMDNKYSEVWKVAQRIEGLCNGVGSHAGGVIFYDEPITNSTALMQTTNGDIVTQFDLHTCESVSLIKIDLLSIEALDRIRACLDLLTDYGYIDKNLSLRERYENTIGVYKIDRTSPDMWKMIHEHKIESLFQMEEDSGIRGIKAVQPETLEELATLNSVIRLMPQEKGGEQPINKFARFKKNIKLWYQEMENYGLTKEEQKLLEPLLLESSGICESQERFMQLVQMPEAGGFSLAWSDQLRKSIAKKNSEAFEKLEKEFYKNMEEKKLSKNFCNYVWKVLICTSKGYGFNLAHTLSYSIIGLQEMNLAYNYPIIFWNTANLIVDSGAMNLDKKIDFQKSEDEDDEEQDGDCKLENSSTDYGAIAAAIGRAKLRGIKFSLPDINKSSITFIPDVKNDTILYGIRGITRIGNQLIKDIMTKRPYTSIEDFLEKVKVNKTQMIMLIKSGAFDGLYAGRRSEIMKKYIDIVSEKKKRITLQNMQMLIGRNMIPDNLDFERRVFNFNKYLKKFKKDDYFILDEHAMDFYTKNYDESKLENVEVNKTGQSGQIKQTTWDNYYQKAMNPVREWIKNEQEQILNELNQKLFDEIWSKYALGSLSKWEMDSLGFYYHEHELEKLKKDVYGIVNYFDLKEEPEIERSFMSKDGTEINLYKISRIAGTVIDKDKNKSSVMLLTPDGVVSVKVWKNQFASWDKQISERGEDGVKHVIEKSWFTRGTKLIITGIRRDDNFVPKKYKNTEYPLFEKIIEIDEKGFITKSVNERAEEKE